MDSMKRSWGRNSAQIISGLLKWMWFGTWRQMANVICNLASASFSSTVEQEGTHVDDSEDDTHLHLERVGEDERVVDGVPGRVDTEGVAERSRNALDDFADGGDGRPAELGLGEVEREGEDVVVDESGVDGEDLSSS